MIQEILQENPDCPIQQCNAMAANFTFAISVFEAVSVTHLKWTANSPGRK
jgi:hypothetical protein